MKKNIFFLGCALMGYALHAEEATVQKDIEVIRSNGVFLTELTEGSNFGLFATMMKNLSSEEKKAFYRASLSRQKELEKEMLELAKNQKWDFDKQREFALLVKQNTYFGAACPQETQAILQEMGSDLQIQA